MPGKNAVCVHLPVLAATIFLAGCASQKTLFEGVVRSRQAAVERWTVRQKAENADRPSLAGKLSLKDSINLAVLHNRTLRAARLDKDVAEAAIRQASSVVYPGVTANAGYTRLDEVSVIDVVVQKVPMGFVDNYSTDLTVTMPLFHGGGIRAGINAAKFSALLADETFRGAVQETVFLVSKAYYDILLSQQLQLVNKEALKSAETHLSDVEAKYAKGITSDYDVLRARIEKASFQAEVIRQENSTAHGMAALLEAMGVSQDSKVELSDTIQYLPAQHTLDESFKTAQQNRPDLYAGELAVRTATESLRSAKSAYWPQADLFFVQEWGNPDPHSSRSDEWGDAWYGGASLSLPLFEGFATRARVADAEAKLKQAEIARESAEEKAYLDVKQAILDISSAEKLVESQKVNVDGAKEALKMMEAAYRQGVRTEVEVVDARTALARAVASYCQAMHSHVLARLNLSRATGVLGPLPGGTVIPAEK